MSRAVFTHPVAAGRAILDFRRDGLENLFDMRPRGGIAAGHDGGTESRSLLAARNAGADEQKSFAGESLGAAVGIREKRVAAIDDNVSGFKMRQDAVDHLVDGRAGLHHQHHPPWPLERFDQFRDGVGAHDLRAGGFAGDELVNLGDGPVEHGYAIPVVVHIQDEVLAHHSKADQSDIAASFFHDSSFYSSPITAHARICAGTCP